MTRFSIPFTFVLFAACGSSSGSGGGGGGDAGSGSNAPPAGPHAMGTITVIEAHSTTGTTATSTVVAGFIPDSTTAAAICTKTVAGCEIPLTPSCGGMCGSMEACTFDQSCNATCKPICTAQCSDSEECYFPTPTTSGCRERESFDAGTLSFTGMTTPVTLFPPYSFQGIDSGSLFNNGAALSVAATGASTAGYHEFSESFTATNLFSTSPGLDKLGITDVFGTGNVPVRWAAGEDNIVVTATVTAKSGMVGTFACKGDDTAGSFDVPRAAINAVLAANDPLAALTLAVTRKKITSVYDLSTMGMVPGVDVQPVGWLDLATTSTETTAFQGCNSDEQVCGNACVDTSTDNDNCGMCTNTCASGDACATGTCAGPTACQDCVNVVGGSACAAAHDACSSNADCVAFSTCYDACAATDTTCQQACTTAHPNAVALYDMWPDCICDTACPVECGPECS